MNGAIQEYIHQTEAAFPVLEEPEQRYLAYFSAFVSNYYSSGGIEPISPAAVAWTFGSPQALAEAYQSTIATNEAWNRHQRKIKDSKRIVKAAIAALILMSIALILSFILVVAGIQYHSDTYEPPVYYADEAPDSAE